MIEYQDHISMTMEGSEVRYVAYDDGWLRQILSDMRSDLKEHMQKDRDDLAEISKKLKELREVVEHGQWVLRLGGSIVKWLLGGSGALVVGKTLYEWWFHGH